MGGSMRKSAVVLALLALAGLVAAGQALAASSPKATGDVIADSGTQVFSASFNAQIDKSGPKGSFSVQFTQGSLAGQFYEGSVSCYVQSGNEGSLGGFVTSTNNSLITFVRITVQDNGEGSNATGPGPHSGPAFHQRAAGLVSLPAPGLGSVDRDGRQPCRFTDAKGRFREGAVQPRGPFFAPRG